MTLFFYTDQIIILRSRGTSIISMSATFTTMNATIEPTIPERAEQFGGRPGKTYTAFLGTDFRVKEGDRIVTLNQDDTRNKTYQVKGVSLWQGAGLLDHQELTLTSEVD